MVLLVEGDDAPPEDLLQRDLVGLQRRIEIDQGFFQVQKLDELLVPLGFIELPLHVVINLVNLLQVLKEALSHPQQQIEDKAGFLLGLGVFHQPVLKVPNDGGLL